MPASETPQDRAAERLFREIVERQHRRLGVSRRAFVESACGYAAALSVINQVYGCGKSDTGSDGGGGPSDGGSGPDVGGRDAGFDIPDSAIDDASIACQRLMGDEFIFDVQTHTADPLSPWREGAPLPADAESFIRTLFVGSDTTVACLSGVPGARNRTENPAARQQLEQIVDRLAGPRLLYHVNVDPPRGAPELDYMEATASDVEVAAWKVYPHVGAWRLDSDDVGLPFVEKARDLGVRVIAAHRGIAADVGDYGAPSSPVDLVRAARMVPDVRFLTYHSGWQGNVDENHPFDPDDANPRGVDRLIKAVRDEGIASDGNVYAELGSTWRNLMTQPDAAAHVLGKLLLYLGEDRIVWGTDSVFTGSPQEQIVALRSFTIPQRMQDDYGYPPITDATRRKIFGLNAAEAYGIDPAAVRCAIADDFVEELRMARADDPRSVPVPSEKRFGPRTRREFAAFLRWEEHTGHG